MGNLPTLVPPNFWTSHLAEGSAPFGCREGESDMLANRGAIGFKYGEDVCLRIILFPVLVMCWIEILAKEGCLI
jgi:hypothetical protein